MNAQKALTVCLVHNASPVHVTHSNSPSAGGVLCTLMVSLSLSGVNVSGSFSLAPVAAEGCILIGKVCCSNLAMEMVWNRFLLHLLGLYETSLDSLLSASRGTFLSVPRPVEILAAARLTLDTTPPATSQWTEPSGQSGTPTWNPFGNTVWNHNTDNSFSWIGHLNHTQFNISQ